MSIITDAFAQLVLTWTDVAVNTNTVVIGDKTYTFLDTVGVTDGNVHIGADAEACIDNLVAAVNLDVSAGETGVAGTDYAVATVKNKMVRLEKTSATEITAVCKFQGVLGNYCPVAETLANASWAGAATELAGGTGDSDYQEVETYLEALLDDQPFSINSGVLDLVGRLQTEFNANL